MTEAPKISYDIPVPVGNQAIKGKRAHWRSTICGMKPGGSFDVTDGDAKTIGDAQKAILNIAKQVQIPIKTRKLEGGGLRVWRV